MRRLVLAALALSLSVLPACAPVGAEHAEEEIINGTRETGHPEVVAVYWQMGTTGGGLCTGTVIGPYAVLTAKHCVFSENPDGTYTAVPPGNFFVIETDDINDTTTIGPGDVNYVYEVRTTSGSDVDGDVSNGRDIAVLLLREPIDVAPRAFARSGPAIGANVTAIGFGRTSVADTDSAGVKYAGLMRVTMVGSYQILAGSRGTGGGWTCQGDSGGPLIDDATGEVVGVTSYGFDRSCRIDDSVFVRVAQWTGLIDDALAFVAPCTPSGETCNGIDDNCDGTPDDGIGCLVPGSPCTDSAECLAGRCEDVRGTMVCTTSCLPDSPIPCPSGTYCEVTGCAAGHCVPGSVGALPDGSPCTADTDCASGHCPMLTAGRFCGTACCPGIGVYCASETAICDLVPGAMGAGACVPPELAMGPRAFGQPCDADADCESMDCADPGGFCTMACDPGASIFCPSGFHCGDGTCVAGDLQPQGGRCGSDADCRDGLTCVEGACAGACDPAALDSCPVGTICSAEAGNVCVRPGAHLGDMCAAHEDCSSGVCGEICTLLCDTVRCPTGYECRAAGTVMACYPPGYGVANAGGCAASPAAGRGTAGLALVLGALALALRRARRS